MKKQQYYAYACMSTVPVFIINITEQITIDYLSVIILSQVNYIYHNTSELVASDHLKPI